MEDPTPQDIGSVTYDPFRRSDGYGEIGTGPLPLHHKLRRYLMLAFLGVPRIICSLVLLATLRALCAIVHCMSSLKPWVVATAFSSTSRAMLLVLGFLNIHHKRIKKDPDAPETAAPDTRSRQSLPIVVSNHISWVDILLTAFVYGPGFVTREETRKTPLVGGLCEAIDCIFVDREKSQAPAGAQEGGFQSTADRIAERARQKWDNPDSKTVSPLVIFAEGTTTNGRYLLPLRTGAFVAGVPVQPVLLNYPSVKGRPSLAWESIGAMTHAFLVLSGFLQSASITELPLYSPSEDEKKNPLLYAANVRNYMLKWAAKLGIELKESPSGLSEKRGYHGLLRDKYQMK